MFSLILTLKSVTQQLQRGTLKWSLCVRSPFSCLFRTALLHSSCPWRCDVMSKAWRNSKGCATMSTPELRFLNHWHLCNDIMSLPSSSILKQWSIQLWSCTVWALYYERMRLKYISVAWKIEDRPTNSLWRTYHSLYFTRTVKREMWPDKMIAFHYIKRE